jgi:hypothetical protein
MSEKSIIDEKNRVKFFCVGEYRQRGRKTYHNIDLESVCISTAQNKKNDTTTYLVKAVCPNTENTMCRILSKSDFDILKKSTSDC